MSAKRAERHRTQGAHQGPVSRGGGKAPAPDGEAAAQEMMANREFIRAVRDLEDADARGELPPPKPWSVIEAKIEARRKAEQRRAV